MVYVVDANEFESRWTTMLFTVSVNSTLLLLYALYLALFIFSVHSINRRKPSARRVLLSAAWVMFVLAATGMFLVIATTGLSMQMNYVLVRGAQEASDRMLKVYHDLALAQDVILAINNLVTDLLFLFRCYAIWGGRKVILVVPSTLILATVVVGCITGLGYYHVVPEISPAVPFAMAATTNILMMFLTAGRIWYLRRERQRIPNNLCQQTSHRMDTATAIVMESGLLYCFCIILYVVSIFLNTGSAAGTVFNGVCWALVQLGVNIVPTLILVRVGLGRLTENQNQNQSSGSGLFSTTVESESTLSWRVAGTPDPESAGGEMKSEKSLEMYRNVDLSGARFKVSPV